MDKNEGQNPFQLYHPIYLKYYLKFEKAQSYPRNYFYHPNQLVIGITPKKINGDKNHFSCEKKWEYE